MSVESDDSRFTYFAAQNAAFFKDSDFIPMFTIPEEDIPSDITDKCLNAYPCVFDRVVTGNNDLSLASLMMQNWAWFSNYVSGPGLLCRTNTIIHNNTIYFKK